MKASSAGDLVHVTHGRTSLCRVSPDRMRWGDSVAAVVFPPNTGNQSPKMNANRGAPHKMVVPVSLRNGELPKIKTELLRVRTRGGDTALPVTHDVGFDPASGGKAAGRHLGDPW